jgi:hypothetical protein
MTVLALRAAFMLRGRAALTDAFIPLLLLSWGHYNWVLWSVCAGDLTINLLMLLPIYLIALSSTPSRSAALGMATVVCALPLTGARGLAFAAPLSAWMLLAAFAMRWQKPGAARICALGGTLGFALIALYFVGYHNPGIPPSADLGPWLTSTFAFLSMSIGPQGALDSAKFGQFSVRELWGYTAGTILLTGLIVNAVAAVLERDQFIRRSGMALIIIGSMVLALGIGWGRRESLLDRYVSLGAPGLVAVYISTILRPTCAVGRLLRGVLFTFALIAAWPNLEAGLLGARERHDSRVAPFQRDLRAGLPPMVLADHHSRFPDGIYVRPRWQEMAADIGMLKRAGIGEFRNVQDDPVYQTLDIFPEKERAGDGLTYLVKDSRHVYAIRLTYRYLPQSPHDSWAVCRVTWQFRAESSKQRTREYTCKLPKDGREDDLLIWVNEPISEVHISPDDGDCNCRITDVRLLVRP